MKRFHFNYMMLIVSAIILSVSASSCSKGDEPFDTPFAYLSAEGGLQRIVVNSDVKNVNTYMVYLSSKRLTQNLVVNYEVIAGNGLQEGRDYELVTTGKSLTFLPGIYDMPIRIRWKPNPIDPSKNNTLTIRLTDNNLDVTLGKPGPDELFRQLVIEKKNP